MTATTAKNLLTKNLNTMSLEEIQRHKVRLLDAQREAAGEYGYIQAVRDGFMISSTTESTAGFRPKDLWLFQNLKCAYEQAVAVEQKLLQQ